MAPLPPPDDPDDRTDPAWRHYTKGIKPMARGKLAVPAAKPPAQPPAKPLSKPKAEPAPKAKADLSALVIGSLAPPQPSASLEKPQKLARQEARKLKKGQLVIGAELDLHGMTQEAAHAALLAFITACAAKKLRRVRIITGKGNRSGGALRRAVPIWLAQAPLAGIVTDAHYPPESGGGEGALIVTLRKPEIIQP